MVTWQVIMAAGLALATLIAARSSAQVWTRITLWPMILILGVFAACTCTSVAPERSVERFSLMPLLAMVFPSVQIAGQNTTASRLMASICLACGLVIAADVMLARFAGWSLFQGTVRMTTRAAGSQGNANDVTAAVLLLPLAWLALSPACRRTGYLIASLCTAPAWIFSAGRQALLGWTVSCMWPLLNRARSWRARVFSMSLVTAVVAVAVLAVPPLRNRVLATLDSGLGVREQLMAFGLWQWTQHPWMGSGPGLYGEAYTRAVRDGWTWRGEPLPAVGMPWAHSLPVEVLVDLGVVGGLALGVVATLALRRSLAMRRRPNGVPATLIVGETMSVAILLVGLVDLTFIKGWFQILFWLALGLLWTDSTTERIRSPLP
jgi:hypothetical protein